MTNTAPPASEASYSGIVATASPGPRFIPQLDGLRALAFGSVFVFHALPQMSNKVVLWAGVDLFFVLSGFLITGILMRSNQPPRSSYFLQFYGKRARRILPPYTIAALLGASLFAVDMRNQWPWYVFFASNVGQAFGNHIQPPLTTFWSLAVEEQFYLLWPVAVAACSTVTLWRVGWAGLWIVPLLRMAFSPWLSASGGIYVLTPFRLDLLLAGSLLAITWRRHGGAPSVWARLSTPVLALSFAIFAALSLLPDFRKDHASILFDGLGYSLILVFCTALLTRVLSLPSGSFFYRILTFPPVAYLGKISYMMYLLHSTVIMFCLKYLNGHGRVLSRLVALGGTILLASLSWHVLEKRLLGRQRRPGAPYRSDALYRPGAL